ncbi:MAG: PspC domain-containing protein [Rikenellaceae bacterium]|jgi:phage shock protein PspC (stress-responsive transcriptional regulator)|nr:PspC domain-containing protein [Rikenellaceae bacterium]
MKQIEKVSISGISFMLDVEGYDALNEYLNRLAEAYRDNPDGAEIIADIEARIAEIILNKQAPGSIVPAELIGEVTARMGLPEEEAAARAVPQAEPASGPERTFPRRLYRDPEGAKLGGVCSGLATFFDIDPVWVRVGFFAPLIVLILTAPFGWGGLSAMLGVLTGISPLLYILLWFAVPSARTPRQKLEMRGEKITASSIESNLRASAPRDIRSQKSASVWAEIAWVVGRIALFCIKAVAMIVALCLVFAGMMMLIGIGAALFAADKMVFNSVPLSEVLSQLSGITPEGYAVVTLLAALIPVAMIAVLLFNLIFDKPVKTRVLSILGGIWLIIMIFWGIVTIRNSQQIIDSFKDVDQVELSTGKTRTYELEDLTIQVDTVSTVTVKVID